MTVRCLPPGIPRAIIVVLLAACTALAPGRGSAQEGERVHRLNLSDVDLPLLIGDVAAITGNTFSIHPQVRGKASIVSPGELTAGEVFAIFATTLQAQGYAIVPVGAHAYAIVPDAQALGLGPPREGDPVGTEIVALDHVNAREAAAVATPMMVPGGQARALEGTRLVALTGYSSSIAKAKAVLEQLDLDRTETRVVALAHVGAAEAARLVNGLRQARGNAAYAADVTALATTGGNSVVVQGTPGDVERMVRIIAEIDAAARQSDSPIGVFALDHARAADVKPILDQVIAGRERGSGGVSPGVAVYEPGNTVIVGAPPALLRELSDLVARLDRRRAQVLVEAIIVELTDSKAREIGLQLALYGPANSVFPAIATNFSGAPLSILSLAGALIGGGTSGSEEAAQPGLVGSALSRLAGQNTAALGVGLEFGNGGLFGAILNAVATDTRSRILSTPSVLTLDNQQARILVGQEIPVTSGEVLGSSNENPFRTVVREEVGVELTVTPQIGADDSIRMEITQIVSSVSGPVSATSSELVTNKREISTTILAEDGEVIVLGGLVQDSDTDTRSRVPLLGDIPLLGVLFRDRGTESGHTNLMVFLRPVIVRDKAAAREETRRAVERRGLEDVFDPLAPSTLIERAGAGR